jgi:anti-sigma regulatory factor (Ser/Thr protein kinase)
MNNILCQTADLTDISHICNFVTETAESLGSDQEAAGEIVVALHEGISNTIIHGYKRKPGIVEIEVKRQGDDLFVYLRDEAPLFDPLTVPTPDISLPLDKRAYGGMGIHMMRHFTDELHYQLTDSGQNELVLVKKAAFKP